MGECSARNIRTWAMLGEAATAAYILNEIARENENLAVLTADLSFYSGLERFKTEHPDQFYNLGIAEQNMIAVGSAMAKEGFNVFATTYATFAASRALDQVRVNMGYMKLPLKILGLSGGLSGGILGATHMAIEDIAIMRTIPNMIVVAPADCTETAKVIECAAQLHEPMYIRLQAGQRTPVIYREDYNFAIGKAARLKEGDDILMIATGSMVYTALSVSELLAEEGVSCGVADMHTIKPIDTEFLENAKGYRMIVTLEEHNVIGGLGGAVAEYLSAQPESPPLYRMGVEDFYPHAASYEALLENCNINVERVKERVMKKLEAWKSNVFAVNRVRGGDIEVNKILRSDSHKGSDISAYMGFIGKLLSTSFGMEVACYAV